MMRICGLRIVVVFLLCTTFCKAADPAEDAPAMSPAQVEEKALGYLDAGQQSEAEDLLAKELEQEPDLKRVLLLLKEWQHAEAAQVLKSRLDHYRSRQRVFFLWAACTRSRFEIEHAYPGFVVVHLIDDATPVGKCASKMIQLDSNQPNRRKGHVDQLFAELTALADQNPDDIVIRWMLAVQCRSWDRNEEGVLHYKKILEKWNPGPVLVHQTYANLLDELKRYDEAIVERRKAVELEPASWSYDGLANTLHNRGQFKEACDAHVKAIQLAPSSSLHWSNWGSTLHDAGNFDEAIVKCNRSLALDSKNWRAWQILGQSLEAQGKKAEALEKYRKLLELYPRWIRMHLHVKTLERELAKQAISPKGAPSDAEAKESGGKQSSRELEEESPVP